jgi:uncharacterized MAPEG superfamily protein
MSILGIAGASLAALQQSKVAKVAAGQKTVTAPKTIVGKLIGSVTGRTQAAQVQAMQSQPTYAYSDSGGQEEKKQTVYVAVGVIAILIFIFTQKKRKK